MVRTYNIGTECYGLLTSPTDPEFLLPVQIIILEKYSLGNKTSYKVKIKDIFETDFNYLKEHMSQLKLATNLKTESINTVKSPTFIKKSKLDTFENKIELLNYLNDKPFFLEDNYITLDKEGLKDLYYKFVRYIINFHYTRLFQLVNRSFLANTPIFENQKDMFLKRVNKIGFEDVFKKFDLKIDI